MNNLVKYGLVGIGAWLLWNKFGNQFAGLIPGTEESVGTPAQNTVPTGVTSVPNARSLILAISGNGPYNFDEWNWYYAQARGVAGPTWEAATGGEGDRAYRYTIDEYLALVGAKGFSGRPTSGPRASKFEMANKFYV